VCDSRGRDRDSVRCEAFLESLSGTNFAAIQMEKIVFPFGGVPQYPLRSTF
jgi:hypothetical protein